MTKIIKLDDARHARMMTNIQTLMTSVLSNLTDLFNVVSESAKRLPGYSLINYIMDTSEDDPTNNFSDRLDVTYAPSIQEFTVNFSSMITLASVDFTNMSSEEKQPYDFISIVAKRPGVVVPMISNTELEISIRQLMEFNREQLSQFTGKQWVFSGYVSRVLTYVLLFTRFTIVKIDSESVSLIVYPDDLDEKIEITINLAVAQRDKSYLQHYRLMR